MPRSSSKSGSARPLKGIRVLDLTRLLPGGWAARGLARRGAEVVHVEQVDGGDPARAYGPFLPDGTGCYFAFLRRGQKSLALDLHSAEGRALLPRILPGFDVLLDSFRPAARRRLGIAPRGLARVQPRLIHVSLGGYPSGSERGDAAGHDINFQALSGLLWANRDTSGRPRIPGLPWADLAAGAMRATEAILEGLYVRERTGLGGHREVSILAGAEELAAFSRAEVSEGLPALRREDHLLLGTHPCYAIYPAAGGGHVAVGALEEKFWSNLCRVLGRPDLIPFRLARGRQAARARRILARIFADRSAEAWGRRLLGKETCATPVCEPAPPRGRGVLPRLGRDTARVLRQAGLSTEEIRGLRRRRVVA